MLCNKCGGWVDAIVEDIKIDEIKQKVPVWKCPDCGSVEQVAEGDSLTWAWNFNIRPSILVGFACCPDKCPSCNTGPMVACSDFFLNNIVFPFHCENHPGWLCPDCGFMDKVTKNNIAKWVTEYKGWKKG